MQYPPSLGNYSADTISDTFTAFPVQIALRILHLIAVAINAKTYGLL